MFTNDNHSGLFKKFLRIQARIFYPHSYLPWLLKVNAPNNMSRRAYRDLFQGINSVIGRPQLDNLKLQITHDF